MRGGLWSSFSGLGSAGVPGIFTSVEPYCEGRQLVRGVVRVGFWLPQ